MRDRIVARCVACVVLAACLAGPARALDLEQALRDAAGADPALAASDARAEAARHRIAPAGAWRSPMLELGVNNVPTTGRLDQEPMTMKMVGVRQRIPVFGANGLRAQAARERARSAGADAELARYRTFGETWMAYADLFHADALARHAMAHRGVMDRLVEAARARYASGRGRLEDVLRSEAERATMLADIAMFQAEAEDARGRLDALRGTPSEGEALAPPPDPAVPDAPDAWLAAVDDAHPRLRGLDAMAAGERLGARAMRREVWPDLEVMASYGARETLRDGTNLDDMFSVGVGFMLPIFAGGNEGARAEEMDAMARATEAEREAERRTLAARARTLYAEARATGRTARLLADTVVVVQTRALEASEAAYEAGTTDLWRVFEASHALYEERIALERARQRQAHALAGMLALTGRGDLVGVAVPERGSDTR